jgi:hypothetical protein
MPFFSLITVTPCPVVLDAGLGKSGARMPLQIHLQLANEDGSLPAVGFAALRITNENLMLRLAVDGAVFHYEGNFLQRGDVIERVAGNGDDIGGVARL